MLVDDILFCDFRTLMFHAKTSSIEALFLIVGSNKDGARETSLSMDKYFQTKFSYQRIQLGWIINTRTMTVRLTEE